MQAEIEKLRYRVDALERLVGYLVRELTDAALPSHRRAVIATLLMNVEGNDKAAFVAKHLADCVLPRDPGPKSLADIDNEVERYWERKEELWD